MPVTLERHKEIVYSLNQVQNVLSKKHQKIIPLTFIRYQYLITNWLEKATKSLSRSGNMRRVKESELNKFCNEIIARYVLGDKSESEI